MGVIFNSLAIGTILIAYSVLMAVVQNLLALGTGMARLPATRSLAVITSFISSLLACSVAVSAHEYGLWALGAELSVWPIAIWGTLQMLGAARSFGGRRISLVEAGDLMLTGGDPDAPRFLIVGQYFGLLVGLVTVTVAHFVLW